MHENRCFNCAFPRQLFEGIQAAETRASFTVRAQFLEIYNEEVKDLLAPSAANRSIAIRECPDGQIIVTGGLLDTDSTCNICHTRWT